MEARKLSMSGPQPFQLSLRIRHPSIDPGELSREFKIEPEHSFRAGERRSSRSSIAPPSVHPESYWLGTLESAEWPLDISFPGNLRSQIAQEHLAAATQGLGMALSLSAIRFFDAHAETLRRIRSEGGQVSLLVAISTGEVTNFNLAPETSRVLGDLGITVEFELSDD